MYTIVAVKDTQTQKDFLHVHNIINSCDKQWIRPLDKDINAVFDPRQNKLFTRGGQLERWVLYNRQQAPVGRIAAFINPKYKESLKAGGFGFFDCIQDQAAADVLLDTARNWLLERGMEAMDGPINFGERDKWWGLLIDGFYEPLYHMNYNPPYYRSLFENYGLRIYYEQYCFALPINVTLSNRKYAVHERLTREGYIARHYNRQEAAQFIRDFVTIYNDAWASHGGGKELGLKQAEQLFRTLKPILDEKIIWFIYYHNRPIAFWLNIPDINQYFKYLNGRFGIWQKLKFLYYKTFQPSKRVVGIAFGVVKDFQGKGVDDFMIFEGAGLMQRQLSYTAYEMQWIGSFNPKMVNVAKNLGADISRTLATFRLIFHPDIPFEPHRII